MDLASLSRHLGKSRGLRALGKSAPLLQIGLWFTGSVLLIHHAAFSQAYTFKTIAGVAGTTGTNDGIDQGAQFSFPTGVVPDKAGNLYVADFLNHAVRKLTMQGHKLGSNNYCRGARGARLCRRDQR